MAAGIMMAAVMSEAQGWISPGLTQRIRAITEAAQLPTSLANAAAMDNVGAQAYSQKLRKLDSQRFLELMAMDKKVADGQLSLVLLEGELGGCTITNKFDPALMFGVVQEYIRAATP